MLWRDIQIYPCTEGCRNICLAAFLIGWLRRKLSLMHPKCCKTLTLVSSRIPVQSWFHKTRNCRQKQRNLIFSDDFIGRVMLKYLTLVVCDHGREWLGRLSRVRPQSAGWPSVALRETQESLNLPLLHGEKDLELHAGLSHHHSASCCLWRVLWKNVSSAVWLLQFSSVLK